MIRTITGIVTKIEATRLMETTSFGDIDPQWLPSEITVTARCGVEDIRYIWTGGPHPRIGDVASLTINATEDTPA